MKLKGVKMYILELLKRLKRRKKTMAISITEDVIVHHILPKLPTKSLIRFQCVSKLWQSIIFDPNFNFSSKHKPQALFVTFSNKNNGRDRIVWKLLKNDGLYNPLLTEKLCCPPSSVLPQFLGSCNGLLLFNVRCDIFLWNPSTRYCKKVLELDFLYNELIYDVVSGLSYDVATNDYIALMAFRLYDSPGWSLPLISATLKSKRWKLVSFPYDIDSVDGKATVNYVPHWIASPKDSPKDYKNIIYFDALSNGFKKLPSPNPVDEGKDDKLVGVGVLNECLCMMRVNGRNIELIVMKEYGVKESWTTMFFIPGYHWSMELVFCSAKLDVLLFYSSWTLEAYYPRTNTMERVKVLPNVAWRDMIHINPYLETLVTPPIGYDWNKESDKEMASTEGLEMYGAYMQRSINDFCEEEIEAREYWLTKNIVFPPMSFYL